MAASDPQYTAEDFAKPTDQCDLVMKGGITSGVVYPYAILELARRYRFRSIGGTSAGGIAAAFAAAAEYARQHGDPSGFVRMEARCKQIPTLLASLFQPAPVFSGLMAFLLKAQAGRLILGLIVGFPLTLFLALAAGAALFFIPGGGVLAGVLGLLLLTPAILIARIAYLFLVQLPKMGFGLCPGPTQPGHKTPGLTDWIYDSLQDIALGAKAATAAPLTFGDLAGADFDHPDIGLKMVTTNLSMARPHALPRLDWPVNYEPALWAKLFPAPVMNHMAKTTPPDPGQTLYGIPQPKDLPVVVAVRMSLSFPILFQAIPVVIRDIESARVFELTGKPPTVNSKKAWFCDGGISSNFPIQLFDALLPTRPTFALSLDNLPQGADPNYPTAANPDRVLFNPKPSQGIGVPVHSIEKLGDYAQAIFNAAANWRDQLLGAMPGQRERIARVYLTDEEGGLNLTMPVERSQKLMGYGRQVGLGFATSKVNFSFDEHRWRRTLVTYAQLETNLHALDQVWNTQGFKTWFAAYAPKAQSYKKVIPNAPDIAKRIDALAALGATYNPDLYRPRDYPKPMGKLRIDPDV